jgi:hypothetical protein
LHFFTRFKLFIYSSGNYSITEKAVRRKAIIQFFEGFNETRMGDFGAKAENATRMPSIRYRSWSPSSSALLLHLPHIQVLQPGQELEGVDLFRTASASPYDLCATT